MTEVPSAGKTEGRVGAMRVLVVGSGGREHALCWVYSFAYNLSYMLPETVLTVAGAVLLCKAAPALFGKLTQKS